MKNGINFFSTSWRHQPVVEKHDIAKYRVFIFQLLFNQVANRIIHKFGMD